MKRPFVAVVVLPGNRYQRYEGNKRTHFVQSDQPLSWTDVMLFRVMPDAILPPEAA